MNNYLTQLLPTLPSLGTRNITSSYLQTHQDATPKLKYITIFRPALLSDNAESNEELIKQVICFISSDDAGDMMESNQVDQIRIIGLAQAAAGLAESFSKKSGEMNTIRTGKSTILMKVLEDDFFIVCSVSLPEDNVKEKAITQQMVKLIDQSYGFFKILNASFQTVIDNYNLDILKQLIKEHWTGFLKSYNSENFKYPPTVKWPNSLNYRGFLGFFDHPTEHCLYKKSSLVLSYTMQVEIDRILTTCNDEQNVPTGVIVAYFNKSVPKKYGAIYANTAYDESLGDHSINKTQLVDIYNLLEYYNYHEKLDTGSFTKLSNSDLFSSPQIMKDGINIEVPDTVPSEISSANNDTENRFRTSANAALELLNPISLTNNLVIAPLNYTMSSVMQLTSSVADSNSGPGWLSLPSYLRFGQREEEPAVDIDENDDEEEGHYIVGLCNDETGEVIRRKLVYLETKVSNPANSTEMREYALVVFQKSDFYVTLIYDSSSSHLDDPKFYKRLSEDVLAPFIEELEVSFSGGSILESSLTSIPRSIEAPFTDSRLENHLDSDFFFVIYNKEEGWVKSSLPYLPHPFNDISEVNEVNRMQLNLRSAMFYLHDQLSDTFFLQNDNGQFFHDNSINDYFHKFSTNKINDWMFYYIQYENKYIIIIKNQNHKQKAKRKAPGRKGPEALNGSSASTMASERVTHVGPQTNFLNNLGEDVRRWFETFTISGET